MPINIAHGDSAEFTVEFLDTSGNITIPPSGTLSIVYTDTSGSTAAFSATLTPNGSFFTATWGTSVSALGFANWSITAPGSLFTPADSGQLRIIGSSR